MGLFDGFHRLSDRGEGCSNILAIWVCAAGKGMVFKPFTLGQGLVIIENWSRIGCRLTGSLSG